MADNNGRWKVSQAEFNGFVKAKLENGEQQFNEIKVMIRDFIHFQGKVNDNTDKRMDKIEQIQSRFKGMIATISSVVALVAGFIGSKLGGK